MDGHGKDLAAELHLDSESDVTLDLRAIESFLRYLGSPNLLWMQEKVAEILEERQAS